MKPEELSNKLAKMLKETQEGKLHWRLDIQTTEGKDEKYVVEEADRTWTVDECYVSYLCKYQGSEFCLISYEMIKVGGDEVRTANYLFVPPLGMRFFSLHTLLPHSVEANAFLVSQVHTLWKLLMDLAGKGSGQVDLHITEADVNIEEDAWEERQP